MGLRVWSLALLSGLRTWRCRELWWSLQENFLRFWRRVGRIKQIKNLIKPKAEKWNKNGLKKKNKKKKKKKKKKKNERKKALLDLCQGVGINVLSPTVGRIYSSDLNCIWFPLLCKSLSVWLGPIGLFLPLFLSPGETDLRKHLHG